MTDTTEWIESDDWPGLSVGQLVRVTLGVAGESGYREAISRIVVDEDNDLYISGAGLVTNKEDEDLPLASCGWSLFTQKPSTPELPTEPGYYFDNEAEPWRLNEAGRWGFGAELERSLDSVASFAPFTRLEPVPVTAQKVLDAITARVQPQIESSWWARVTARDILRVAADIVAEFGGDHA